MSVLTGQATQREAADRSGPIVRRWSTRAGTASQGALDAVAAAMPGRLGVSREQAALESAQGQIERLRATVTEPAVALHLHQGKRLGADRRRGRRRWTRW